MAVFLCAGPNRKGTEVKSLEALAKSTVDNLSFNNLTSKCPDQIDISKVEVCSSSKQDASSNVLIKSEEEPIINDSNAKTIEYEDDTAESSVESKPEESVTGQNEDVEHYKEHINNVEQTEGSESEVTEPNNAITDSKTIDDSTSTAGDLGSTVQDIQSNCEVTDLIDDVVKTTVEHAEAQTETNAIKSTIESSESADKDIQSIIEDAERSLKAIGSPEVSVQPKEVTSSEDIKEDALSSNEEDIQSSTEAIGLIGEVKKDFNNSNDNIPANFSSSTEDISEPLIISTGEDSGPAHIDEKDEGVIEKENKEMNILKEKMFNSNEGPAESPVIIEKSNQRDIQGAERTSDKENAEPDVHKGKNHDGIIDILPEVIINILMFLFALRLPIARQSITYFLNQRFKASTRIDLKKKVYPQIIFLIRLRGILYDSAMHWCHLVPSLLVLMSISQKSIESFKVLSFRNVKLNLI